MWCILLALIAFTGGLTLGFCACALINAMHSAEDSE